jgi:competence protein ComEC
MNDAGVARASRVWLWISGIELVLLLVLGRELWRGPDGIARFITLDVGQGDAILLVSPSGKQVLIDGGPDNTVVQRLGEEMPLTDRTIELLILTHPDADHLTGLPEVLRRYQVERILLTGVPKDTARFREFTALVRRENAEILAADPAMDIDLGDGLLLDIIWPGKDWEGKDVNNSSITLRAFHGKTSVLLTGDIEKKTEDDILASGADIDSDILKVPHHGSKTSSTMGFLLATSPNLAVISVAKENSYGHPHAEVIERYEALGIPLRSTAEEGTVSLSF